MISVVIAAYDERENLEVLLPRLCEALPAAGEEREMVFVLAGSDGSRELVESLCAALGVERLRVIHEPEPSGLGRAFRAGFRAVSPDADVVVTMDADLNHRPEELPRLVRALRERQADIVVGSRLATGGRVEGTPRWKRLLSRSVNAVMARLYGLAVRDKTSGYRVYRAEALRRLRFDNPDFAFLPEILIDAARQGMKIAEEPIHFVHRVRGRSKMGIVRTSLSYVGLFLLSVRRPGTGGAGLRKGSGPPTG